MLKFKTANPSDELQEPVISFVPLFPGIFIDLAPKVSTDECEVLQYQYGVGCEYYFHGDKLSKIFIEFPLFTQFDIVPDYRMQEMLSVVKKNALDRTVVIGNHQKTKNAIPQVSKVLVAKESDQIFFFFDEIAVSDEEIVEKDDIQFVKLSNDCFLALSSDSGSIYFIYVENYQKNYWFQDFLFSEPELGVNRINSLRKIIRQSFDMNYSTDELSKTIDKHNHRFESEQIEQKIHDAERKILENILTDFSHHQKLNKR